MMEIAKAYDDGNGFFCNAFNIGRIKAWLQVVDTN